MEKRSTTPQLIPEGIDIFEKSNRAFDVLLSIMANDEARAIFMVPDCLIAPYDGGFDLALKDPCAAQALKRQYSEWASRRADKL
jgi:hypothetical protein